MTLPLNTFASNTAFGELAEVLRGSCVCWACGLLAERGHERAADAAVDELRAEVVALIGQTR